MTIRAAAIEVNRSLPELPAAPYIALADQRWIHRFWGFASSHRGLSTERAEELFGSLRESPHLASACYICSILWAAHRTF
jgi:hypothetical protein